MLPRSPGSYHLEIFCCSPSLYAGSWSRQRTDWGVGTLGWAWVVTVEVCRREWSYILRRLRTTTLSLIALQQWFPNYAPQHTAAPPDVIRCAAKNIEIKINQVEFLKFHPADFCQYSTLSMLVVVIRYAAQCYDNRAIAYVATYRI